jgi:hypothetical protein
MNKTKSILTSFLVAAAATCVVLGQEESDRTQAQTDNPEIQAQSENPEAQEQGESPLVGGGPLAEQVFCTFYPNGPTLTNCVGKYYGCFKMTNGSSFWFTAPTNVTAGTFSDLTNLGANINWSMVVTKKALVYTTWCTNNSTSLSFPATYSTPLGNKFITNGYSFYLYVNTLTNSTITLNNPITLEVLWTTNN